MARKVIGTAGSRRRRWLFLSATLAALGAAAFFIAGAGAVTNSPSGFESGDGNMTLQTTSGTATDWNCFAGSGNTGGFATTVSSPTGCKSTSGAQATTPDQSAELQWKPGQKIDAACPVFTTGNNPPKDEFSDIAEFSDVGSNNVFFYGAATRLSVNGNADGAVEFNHNAIGTGTSVCRSAGDKLITYDFLNGGGSPVTLHVYTWTLTGGSCVIGNDTPPCWEGGQTVSGTDEDGATNAAIIPAGNNGLNGQQMAINQFLEFGVNLTHALGLTGCTSFPQQVWESRSSGSSPTSNPEDIEITPFPINTCGSITIVKHTDPRGLSQQFSYTGSGTGVASSFALNDSGNSTLDSPCAASATSGSTTTNPCNSITFGNLNPGSYSVAETAQAGYTLEGLTCKNNGTTDNSVVDTATATVAIPSLAAGDNWVCIYTNQAQGEIKIIKHTSPRGINQVFSYSSGSGSANGLGTNANAGGVACTSGVGSGVSSGSFCLNDSGNTSADNSANTLDVTGLSPGSYNVTETLPAGWTLGGLTCTHSGTGSTGAGDTTTPTQADITLGAGGLVTCTYVNNQPSGAIVITKTGKDKNCVTSSTSIGTAGACTGAGTAALSGASFSIQGTDLLGGTVSKTGTTGSNGKVCVDGLPWNGSGRSYTVTETGHPTGFSIDNTSGVSVTVTQDATCLADGSGVSTGTAATQSFSDTPLTTLEVKATGEASAGTTKTTIICTHQVSGSPVAVGTSVTTPADPADWLTQHLAPDTYTCTVVIDP